MDTDRIWRACADLEFARQMYERALDSLHPTWKGKRKHYNLARKNLENVVMNEYLKSKGK